MKKFKDFLKESKFNPEEYFADKPLTEASLSRIWQNLNNPDMCMICISADRDEIKDPKNIKKRQLDIERDIKNARFGFIKVKGGFTENKDTENEVDVVEKSFLVTFKKDRLDEAMLVFTKLAKKYNQDSFLLVSDGESKYIDKNGKEVFKLGKWSPRQVDVYFTQLKNGRKFSFNNAEINEANTKFYPTERRYSDYIVENLKNGIYECLDNLEYEKEVQDYINEFPEMLNDYKDF